MSEERVVQLLTEAQRVMVFCGAGVSAESGIPTFRGTGGLWDGFDLDEVATPEGFRRNPRHVWQFYAARMEQLARVEPNPAHRVLAAMARHYPDFLLVTQNVDNLHERAGSPEVLHLHGELLSTRCTVCGTVASPAAPLRAEAMADGPLPTCSCGELLRPNVVWFGEMLDPTLLQRVDRFMRDARPEQNPLLLIIGTSGSVSSGYGVLEMSRFHWFRSVEINPEVTHFSEGVDVEIREPAGSFLGRVWPRVAPYATEAPTGGF